MLAPHCQPQCDACVAACRRRVLLTLASHSTRGEPCCCCTVPSASACRHNSQGLLLQRETVQHETGASASLASYQCIYGPKCTAKHGADRHAVTRMHVSACTHGTQTSEGGAWLTCICMQRLLGMRFCATTAPAVAAAVAAVLLLRCLGCCPPSQALPAHVWWDCPACMQHTTPARLFHVIGIQKVICCFRRTVDEACQAYLRRVEDTCSTGCCCFWLVVSRCDVKA